MSKSANTASPDCIRSKTAIPCVGVIVFRADCVLLIQRGTPPRKGEWSIPGGRIERGEHEVDAAVRELMEETGVSAKILGKTAVVKANFEGFDYILHDYAARWISGVPIAGDDAAQAKFVKLNQIDALGMWPKTTEVIHHAYARFGAKELPLSDKRVNDSNEG